jgi:hypothetical protein
VPGKPGFYLPGMSVVSVLHGNCRQALDPVFVQDMRATLQGGNPLDNGRFRG